MPTNIEKLASVAYEAITEEEGKLLSRLYLSKERLGEQNKLFNNFLIRGLIDKNGYISPSAFEAVSYYPLLGKYKKTRPYSKQFLPMLLAIVANGGLSNKAQHWERYLSSGFFTGIFPLLEPKSASSAGIKCVKSLMELKIIKEGLSRLRLNNELALSFYSLNEETRLSYIILPSTDDELKEKSTHAIELAFRLREIKDIEKALKEIENITGFDLLPYLDFLLDIGVIYSEDGIYNGTEQYDSSECSAVISSDFVISITGDSPIPLFMFLTPIKADVISQWSIERNGLKNAFSFGYSPKDIIDKLSSLASNPVPDTIKARIDSWYEAYCAVRVERALVLVADEKNSRILENLPLIKIHILSHPAGNVFLMNPDTEAEWRNILTYSGFDMLGSTGGLEFKEKEKDIELIDIPPLPPLPIERKVPYDFKKHKELLENETNPIKRAFISSGIVDYDRLIESIKIVDGLDFQEKLRVVAEAIHNNTQLYIEHIGGKYEIIKPIAIEKKDDSTILRTEGKTIVVDKLWKVAMLPSYIIDNDY